MVKRAGSQGFFSPSTLNICCAGQRYVHPNRVSGNLPSTLHSGIKLKIQLKTNEVCFLKRWLLGIKHAQPWVPFSSTSSFRFYTSLTRPALATLWAQGALHYQTLVPRWRWEESPQTVVNHCVGSGSRTWFLCKSRPLSYLEVIKVSMFVSRPYQSRNRQKISAGD